MTPDDYIPQRLRWMTEWAEWFCKMQSEAYKKLKEQCSQCKEKGNNCMHGRNECNTCTAACKAYRDKIKKWEKQWTKIKGKYEELYLQAQRSSAGTGFYDPDYQQVVAFFKELQKANGDNELGVATSPYFTAAGYIHQEAQISDCKIQTDFCEKKKGGNDNNEKYAFHPEPYDHKKACACDGRNPDVKVLEDPCDIVEEFLKQSSDSNGRIDKCKSKTGEFKWECDPSMFKDNNDGTCMPPRRQNLCVHYLTQL
ncbi:hypothetical protein PFTANZ_06338, partial [Plasmodium falciparum Tanzania (2000708)]